MIAIESKFGWLLSGPVQNESNHENDSNTVCQRIEIMPVEESKLDNLLTKFWETESAKYQKKATKMMISIKSKKTIPLNKATVRYNVRLPWKVNKHDLPGAGMLQW